MQRNSMLQIEAGWDRELYRTEAVAGRVDMFGTVFLGLATGCARCRNRKFDPISPRVSTIPAAITELDHAAKVHAR